MKRVATNPKAFSPPNAAAGSANGRGSLTVVVLIDALGWSYVDGCDFLGDVLTYRRPLRTVLGFSSGAIPTILTGVPPSQNGHWNLFYYDPKGSPFGFMKWFQWMPERMLDNRYTRKIIQQLGRRVLGMGPLFECCVSPRLLPHFNWVEKKNIYDRGGIVGASSIFDEIAEGGIPYRVYSYHHYTDETALRQATHDIGHSDGRFFFVYLSEMDSLLHMHCDDPVAVGERLAWYGSRLRELHSEAVARDAEARFLVLSDHGMTPVTRKYDLLGDIERLKLRMPDDYLVVFDSTMARFWFFNESAKARILECLNTAECGRVLADDDLKQLGVFFPDRRFGELVYLLHPGWLLSRSDFNGTGWNPVGMHGYHPDDRFSDGIFLANHCPSREVRTLADVHDCMLEALAGSHETYTTGSGR